MTTEITIKRVGGDGHKGYWLANDGAWSPDGVSWISSIGTYIHNPRHRIAYKQLIDSEAGGDDIAKVGDWVEHKHAELRFQVMEASGSHVYNATHESLSRLGLMHGEYKIVPAPEPETFTGDARKWGPGVYASRDHKVVVCVNRYKDAFGYGIGGSMFGKEHRYAVRYIRLSHNPADFPKILAEPGEGE